MDKYNSCRKVPLYIVSENLKLFHAALLATRAMTAITVITIAI